MSQPFLTGHLALLLLQGTKAAGTFEPDTVLAFVEESMTVDEAELARAFLAWCQRMNKTFGQGNLSQRFAEFAARPRGPR